VPQAGGESEAAKALNVYRNTVGPWFAELIERGFITMMEGPHLGPEGIGRATVWALQELPTVDGQGPSCQYRQWKRNKKKSFRRH
jgi:hypothetical protein